MATYNDTLGATHNFLSAQLSHKFGPEVTNYFSGSPLNRVSFLRSDTAFLAAALPHGRYLLLNRALDPLTASPQNLAYVTHADVQPLIRTHFTMSEEAYIGAYDSSAAVPPTLLFLGLDEADTGSGFEHSGKGEARYAGRPYFAVDVGEAESVVAALVVDGREFRKTRLNLKLVPGDAAILAHARSLIDWNNRNKFCSACGARTLSVHAGTKRVCPPYDNATSPPTERPACISRQGVQNIAFPRTDPTVIMAIINHAGDKVLLGRQQRWPDHFFSCLAGFCEPSESIEEAVRRETWEESGVRVGRVVVHSSQPWPYPASLMIGCIGEALPDGEQINLGHDPELEAANWYPLSFIREMLAKPSAGIQDPAPEGFEEGDIRLPPSTAIAHQLLIAVSHNYHGGLKI